MKTILVPVDFSPVTPAVIDEAAALAAGLGARLLVVHVTPHPVQPTAYTVLPMAVAEFYAGIERDTKAQLERLRQSLAARFVDTETIHLRGSPVEAIRGQAASSRVDYIVIGSHGHTALFDLVFGGTTHGILKGAPCPVVVVPATAARPALRAPTSGSARLNRTGNH